MGVIWRILGYNAYRHHRTGGKCCGWMLHMTLIKNNLHFYNAAAPPTSLLYSFQLATTKSLHHFNFTETPHGSLQGTEFQGIGS